jgi:hypothetical protein
LALDLVELMGAALQGLDAVADAQRLELQPGIDHEAQGERKDREQNQRQFTQPPAIAFPDEIRVDDRPVDGVGVAQSLKASAPPAAARSGCAD